MTVAGGHIRHAPIRGLEQFEKRGAAGQIGYCIAGGRPYALEFTNDADVICLLIGDIVTETKFEDDAEKHLLFAGQSAAFHPRGGNVRVRAAEVQHGFVAFSYDDRWQERFDDIDLRRTRRAGSQNNVRRETIASLARYAQNRVAAADRMTQFEIQTLASLVYLETLRCLGAVKEEERSALSDHAFDLICEFIEAELGNEITCAGLADAAHVPLRVVFDGMKARTGMSPYRFVMDKRVMRARDMLRGSSASIAEIALACGFSSQQHLTSTFTSKLGTTPQQVRLTSQAASRLLAHHR